MAIASTVSYQSDFVSERVSGVMMDPDTRMVYVAVDVNKNRYYNRTVHLPGEKPAPDN